MTDSQLTEMVKAGGSQERRATNCLYERFFGKLTYELRHHRLTEDEILGAYNDAVVQLVKSLKHDQFEGRNDAKMGAFFSGIFSNKIVDALRSKDGKVDTSEKGKTNKAEDKRGEPSTPKNPPPPPSAGDGYDDSEWRKQRQRCLRTAMNRLDPKCRELLTDYMNGHDHEELMEIYDFSSEAVARQRVYVCKGKLTEIIAEICKTEPGCHVLCQGNLKSKP